MSCVRCRRGETYKEKESRKKAIAKDEEVGCAAKVEETDDKGGDDARRRVGSVIIVDNEIHSPNKFVSVVG